MDLDTAVTGADIVVVLTDHNEYKNMDLADIAQKMNHPVLFDTRNIVHGAEGTGLTVVNYGNLYQFKK